MSRYCRHGCDPRNCSDCDSVTGEALPPVASSPSRTPETDRIVERFRKGQTSSDGLILTLESIEIKLNRAVAIIMDIEERYIDGSDTYEDWKFMGDTARAFLSENAQAMASADTQTPTTPTNDQ